MVLDQVSEADCGVVTTRVRERLAELGEHDPDKFILADSRERIGLFRGVCAEAEPAGMPPALPGGDDVPSTSRTPSSRWPAESVGRSSARRATRASAWPTRTAGDQPCACRRTRSHGPIDIVGAGDSTSAGIACAVAAGAAPGRGGGVRQPGGVDHHSADRHDRHRLAGAGPAALARGVRSGRRDVQDLIAEHAARHLDLHAVADLLPEQPLADRAGGQDLVVVVILVAGSHQLVDLFLACSPGP